MHNLANIFKAIFNPIDHVVFLQRWGLKVGILHVSTKNIMTIQSSVGQSNPSTIARNNTASKGGFVVRVVSKAAVKDLLDRPGTYHLGVKDKNDR